MAETAIKKFLNIISIVNCKIKGIAVSTGSASSYTFHLDSDNNLLVNESFLATVLNAVAYLPTVKIDGQNCIISNGVLYMRYDWRDNVAIVDNQNKIAYLPFPKNFTKHTKLDKKAFLQNYQVSDKCPFTIYDYMLNKHGNDNYTIYIIGEHNEFNNIVGINRHDVTLPFKCIELRPNANVLLGETTEDTMCDPPVIYRPNVFVKCVDCPFIGRQNVPLLELMTILYPNSTMATFEDISFGIQDGKYHHADPQSPYKLRKNVITLYPHGATTPNIPFPPLPTFTEDQTMNILLVQQFAQELYNTTIKFSFEDRHHREGIVFYFRLKDNSIAMFKINQGHMKTFSQLMKIPLLKSNKELFFD